MGHPPTRRGDASQRGGRALAPSADPRPKCTDRRPGDASPERWVLWRLRDVDSRGLRSGRQRGPCARQEPTVQPKGRPPVQLGGDGAGWAKALSSSRRGVGMRLTSSPTEVAAKNCPYWPTASGPVVAAS